MHSGFDKCFSWGKGDEKKTPRAGSFLEVVYKVTTHSIYLSKNMLLRESFHQGSSHL